MPTTAKGSQSDMNNLSPLYFRRLTYYGEARADAHSANAQAANSSDDTLTQCGVQDPTNEITPKISIIADGNIVIRKNVSRDALMACSTKMYDLSMIKPTITYFRVPHKTDQGSIERLLDMFTSGQCLDASFIVLTSNNFVDDVLMYQACLALGIKYTYTRPLLNALRAEITARSLTFDEMNAVVDRISATNALFKHLAQDLCRRRHEENIGDDPSFAEWLDRDSKKGLKSAMQEIYQERERMRDIRRISKAAVIVRCRPSA